MKIALATPLYPPDVAEPAPYGKELAQRLSEQHQVTVLTYGFLPEQVPGVNVQVIKKQLPTPLRLMAFTIALWKVSRSADALIVENGQSVELPAYVSLFARRKPTVFHIGDVRAAERILHRPLLSFIHRRLRSRCAVITSMPLPRPEILPFEEYPADAVKAYEASWHVHLQELAATIHGT